MAEAAEARGGVRPDGRPRELIGEELDVVDVKGSFGGPVLTIEEDGELLGGGREDAVVRAAPMRGPTIEGNLDLLINGHLNSQCR